MRKRIKNRRGQSGFTMVEILVVICIIGILISLGMATIPVMLTKARTQVCAANLSQIGIAMNQLANDNNGVYPEITNGAPYADYPAGSGAQTLYQALSTYGVTEKTLLCPLDQGAPGTSAPISGMAPAAANSYYYLTGSSYEWSPAFDDEAAAAPVLYIHGQVIPVQNSKVRLCMDYVAWHQGKTNRLYADGHVIAR